MSRSYKRPYVSLCGISRGSMKEWKKQCNGVVRRCKDEDAKVYKKINDVWLAPDDGKSLWKDPKARRK